MLFLKQLFTEISNTLVRINTILWKSVFSHALPNHLHSSPNPDFKRELSFERFEAFPEYGRCSTDNPAISRSLTGGCLQLFQLFSLHLTTTETRKPHFLAASLMEIAWTGWPLTNMDLTGHVRPCSISPTGVRGVTGTPRFFEVSLKV